MRRRDLTCWLAASAFALLANAAGASESPEYLALRQARPDGRQISLREPVVLERDALRFELRTGTVHFLQPLDGRTWGAVFVGEGSFRLSPVTEDERKHLAYVTGKTGLEVLEDRFSRLVLLFADDTAEELALAGTVEAGSPDSRAADVFKDFLTSQRKDFKTNFLVRLLADLLDTPALKSGVFLASFNGEDLPPVLAAVDPRGAEALHIEPLVGGEDTVLFAGGEVQRGFWYACDRRGEVKSGRRTPYKPSVDALHYAVDTTVTKGEKLSGTTTIDLAALAPARVLQISLLSTLRIQEASFRAEGDAEWQPIPWVQEKEKEDADPALILPAIQPKGSHFAVRLTYAGDEVIFDGGDVWFVGARSSWYPNVGTFLDPATFDLTFRLPLGLEVVATGERQSSEAVGNQEVSTWRASDPIRVAGFNYGKFLRVDQQDEVSGIEVSVYANRKVIEFLGRGAAQGFAGIQVSPDAIDVVDVGPQETTGRRNPKDLAATVAVDAINATRLYHTYFGPIPQRQVAVTQQIAFGFGQAWPSLVFLPYSAFLTGTARNSLGLAGGGYDQFVERVGFHEMAHQWWGHAVGWESYRDQWLSEGLAEFSAALAVQHTEGWDAYTQVWQDERKNILSRTGTATAFEVGPITRGTRLSTAKAPAAYPILAYSKGAFVLHMLRMLMWDGAASLPDGAFIALMKDFVSTFSGQSPSTEDFKKTVERHMVGPLNVTGDGKVGWFFNQWVYGTEIPVLKSDLKAQKLEGDQYKVTGSVSVSGVSDGFKVLVPLYADLGKGRLVSFGRVPFSGSSSRQIEVTVRLPDRPKRLLVNARLEVLARDE